MTAMLFAVYPGALALAESENGGINLGANIQTNIETDGRGAASLNSTTSADINDSDSGEIDEDTHRVAAPSTMHRESSERNSDEQGDDEDDNDEIEVDHDAALQATTTIENSDEVDNWGELRSFLNHVVKEDDRIADVHVSSTSVETEYALPARFLWAIPTNISAQVSVEGDGSVTITYPWYAFLFARHDDELKTQLTQAASSTIGAGASTTLSARTQAHLLNLILSILKGD